MRITKRQIRLLFVWIGLAIYVLSYFLPVSNSGMSSGFTMGNNRDYLGWQAMFIAILMSLTIPMNFSIEALPYFGVVLLNVAVIGAVGLSIFNYKRNWVDCLRYVGLVLLPFTVFFAFKFILANGPLEMGFYYWVAGTALTLIFI